MQSDYVPQFLHTACAGFGLFLVGVVNLVLLRRSVAVRVAASALAIGVTLGAAKATLPGTASSALVILVAALVPCLLLSSRRFVAGLLAVQRPAILFSLLTLAGIATAIGSVIVFENADEKATADSLSDLDLFDEARETLVATRSWASTDRGTPVSLKEPVNAKADRVWAVSEVRILSSTQLADHVIRRGQGGEHSNCHGWVFSAGKFRVSSDEVQLILNENGYQEVRDPHPGDVVVYRQNGSIAHTAIVRYVTEGQPVMVEGKWGALGVLLHAVEKSVYGTDFAYYRSSRSGHSLVGVDGRSMPATKIQRTVATE